MEDLKKETLGSYLKSKREEKNITLEEIAAETKINTKVLDSLEQDALNELPSHAFVRGFIKSYCKYVGIDQNKALMLYDILYYGVSVDTELDKYIKKDLVKINKVSKKLFWYTSSFLSLLFILGIFIYFVNKNYKIEHEKDLIVIENVEINNTIQETKPVNIEVKNPIIEAKKEPSIEPINETKKEEKVAIKEEPIEKKEEPIINKEQEIRIFAKKLVWIKVQLDENHPFDFMLPADKTRILKAKNKIKVVIGDASSVKINYQGKELDNLGLANAVRSIVFPGLERWR